MKKFFALLLACMLIVTCFAGCAENDENKLVMATNAAFPPYEFKADDGSFAGIDVEIAELIAKELGLELEIVDIDFGAIVAGVETGKYDIGMAGLTVTDERKESVNFSTSYATGIQSVIVKADSTYASFEDFYTGFDADGNPAGVKEGIKIGVQQDTTGDIYSSDVPAKWGFGETNVERYKTGADAVEALKSGKVTAVIIDNEPAKSFVNANEGLKILDGSYAEEDYAIAINKEDTELLDKVNDALKKLTDNGEIAKIVNKYIPANADEK